MATVIVSADFVYIEGNLVTTEDDLRDIPGHTVVPWDAGADPNPPVTTIQEEVPGLTPLTQYAYQVIGHLEDSEDPGVPIGEDLGAVEYFVTLPTFAEFPEGLADVITGVKGNDIELIFPDDTSILPGSTVRLYARCTDWLRRDREPTEGAPFIFIRTVKDCVQTPLVQVRMNNCVEDTPTINGPLYYFDFPIPAAPAIANYNVVAMDFSDVEQSLEFLQVPITTLPTAGDVVEDVYPTVVLDSGGVPDPNDMTGVPDSNGAQFDGLNDFVQVGGFVPTVAFTTIDTVELVFRAQAGGGLLQDDPNFDGSANIDLLGHTGTLHDFEADAGYEEYVFDITGERAWALTDFPLADILATRTEPDSGTRDGFIDSAWFRITGTAVDPGLTIPEIVDPLNELIDLINSPNFVNSITTAYPAVDKDNLRVGTSGGLSIVREVDGSPEITDVSVLEFHQDDGFIVSEPSSGTARVRHPLQPHGHDEDEITWDPVSGHSHDGGSGGTKVDHEDLDNVTPSQHHPKTTFTEIQPQADEEYSKIGHGHPDGEEGPVDHEDLENVTPSQHHTRYTDTEAKEIAQDCVDVHEAAEDPHPQYLQGITIAELDGSPILTLRDTIIFDQDDGFIVLPTANDNEALIKITGVGDDPSPLTVRDKAGAEVFTNVTTIYIEDGALSDEGSGDPCIMGFEGPEGPAGPAGDDGQVLHNGTGDPAPGLGEDGDYYIDTDDGDLFFKVGGVWTSIGQMKGPQGDDGPIGPAGDEGPEGPAGPQGDPGTGTRFTCGSGIPNNAEGNTFDVYLDTDEPYNLYTKNDVGVWVLCASLQGPQGLPGGVTVTEVSGAPFNDAKSQDWAGETITRQCCFKDDNDRPLMPQPDGEVTVDVMNRAETILHADDVPTTLKHVHDGTVDSVDSDGEFVTITDATADWLAGDLCDCIVRFTSGALDGQSFRIGDNYHNDFTIDSDDAQPSIGDSYYIHKSCYEVCWDAVPQGTFENQYVVFIWKATDTDPKPYTILAKDLIFIRGPILDC